MTLLFKLNQVHRLEKFRYFQKVITIVLLKPKSISSLFLPLHCVPNGLYSGHQSPYSLWNAVGTHHKTNPNLLVSKQPPRKVYVTSGSWESHCYAPKMARVTSRHKPATGHTVKTTALSILFLGVRLPFSFLCISGARGFNWPFLPTGTYLGCHFPVVNPAQSGEVGGLCAVEAVIEASVVTVWKGNHELSSLLGDLKNRNKRPHASADRTGRWFSLSLSPAGG